MTSSNLVPDIKREEGLELEAYQDIFGLWTIGYGHQDKMVYPGLKWSQAKAELVLADDVRIAVKGLANALPWWPQLDDIRQDVLVNMAFNLGLHGVLLFKRTLKAIELQHWKEAHDEILNSLAAKQLPKRYKRLAEQMLTGVHQS